MVGLSVVFAKGSPVYTKLCQMIALGNNLVENLTVNKSKGYLFVKAWEITSGIYFDFLQEIWHIVTFTEVIKVAVTTRLNQFKAGY